MIHLCRFCLATRPSPHTPNQLPPHEKFLPHHPLAQLPRTPPPPASWRGMQGFKIPPCLSATGILTQPQNVSGYVWNKRGELLSPPPPPGEYRKQQQKSGRRKALTQHKEIISILMPHPPLVSSSSGPEKCLCFREKEETGEVSEGEVPCLRQNQLVQIV